MSDELREYDLSAWEAPAPPAGLADAVLSRVREPAAVGAIEPLSRPVRWWWIGAAVAAVAAAVLVLAIAAGGTAHVPSAFGAVAADRARSLDLVTATAELEPGALVAWRREHAALVVAQPRGAAAWHVVPGEQLRVDLDAIPASIEATGASLRVEVHMNISDARVIGASALTAAAVAFATVVVYEGHVEVTSGGQTVQIEPGATVELQSGKPPAPPDLVGERERIRLLEQREAELGPAQDIERPAVGPTRTPAQVPLETALTNEQISEGMEVIKPKVMECTTPKPGIVKVHVKVAATGDVTEVTVTQTPDRDLGSCVEDAISGAVFATTQRGGSFSYPFVFEATKAPANCDAEALEAKALDDEAMGQHAAALQLFENQLACKETPRGIQLAFMAACNSNNPAKAKKYYKKMAPDAQARFSVMCVRRGITRQQLDAP